MERWRDRTGQMEGKPSIARSDTYPPECPYGPLKDPCQTVDRTGQEPETTPGSDAATSAAG
eukprot:scaffold3100_cov248-Pinguiococcus_pyrenoidosus.AAC.4